MAIQEKYYLKSISKTGNVVSQTLMEDLIDSLASTTRVKDHSVDAGGAWELPAPATDFSTVTFVDGDRIIYRITHTVINNVITLPAVFRSPTSATSPLLWSIIANRMDMLSAIYNATEGTWDVVSMVPGYTVS